MFSAILPAFYQIKVAEVTVLCWKFFISVKPDLYVHVLYKRLFPNKNQGPSSVDCLIFGWSLRFFRLSGLLIIEALYVLNGAIHSLRLYLATGTTVKWLVCDLIGQEGTGILTISYMLTYTILPGRCIGRRFLSRLHCRSFRSIPASQCP